MSVLPYFFIFIMGLVIGSFLNVLIYRLPNSITLSGRSFCPKCKKKISWYDNIPLFSYLLLKGKCRNCHSPISVQYPLVELLTGLLFFFVFQVSGFKFQEVNLVNPEAIWLMAYSLWLVSAFLVIFIIDLKFQIIPDSILLTTVVVSLPYAIYHTPYAIPSSLSSGLFFLAIFLLTRGKGIGFGDVKFAFLIGLILGFPKSVLGIYLAFVLGAIWGLILIILKQKKFGQKIAFGPFLVLGTVTAFFFGNQIINWLALNYF